MRTNDAIKLGVEALRAQLLQIDEYSHGKKAGMLRAQIKQAIAKLNELKEPPIGSMLLPLPGPAGNNDAESGA